MGDTPLGAWEPPANDTPLGEWEPAAANQATMVSLFSPPPLAAFDTPRPNAELSPEEFDRAISEEFARQQAEEDIDTGGNPIQRGLGEGIQSVGDTLASFKDRFSQAIGGASGLATEEELENIESYLRKRSLSAKARQQLHERLNKESVLGEKAAGFIFDATSMLTESVGATATGSLPAYFGFASANDAYIDSNGNESYAIIQGVLEAGLMVLGGKAAKKFGAKTFEEMLGQGPSQKVKQHLIGMATELGEEELTYITQTINGALQNVHEMPGAKNLAKQAGYIAALTVTTTGAVSGLDVASNYLDNPSRSNAKELGIDSFVTNKKERQAIATAVQQPPGELQATTEVVAAEVDPSEVVVADTLSGDTANEEGLATKNVDMARVRELMGLAELDDPSSRSWQQDVDDAVAGQVPDRVLDIATDLLSNPRSLSSMENAGFVIKGVELEKRYQDVTQQMAALTPEESHGLAVERSRIEQEFDVLSRALKAAGTEEGRSLNARKMRLDSDYNILSVKHRAKMAKGREITATQGNQLETLANKHNETERQIAAKRKRLEKQIADMEERLANEDFDIKERKQELPLTKELEELTFQRNKLRTQINAKIRSLQPKSIWYHIANPLNAARTLMTSLDLSAVLRQGGFVAIGNPKRAAKGILPMLRSFASERQAHKTWEEIQNRENAPLYAQAKLYLADTQEALSQQEEAFMSRWVEKIPLVAGSARAYLTFLNKLRADAFDTMAATLARNGEPTLEESQAIANYINVATGRAPLGKFEDAGLALSTIFFAPRYAISRFQLIAGQPLYRGSGRTKKLIAKEYAKFLIGMGAVYSLAQMAFGDDEDYSITFDPLSSDFGKIRLGNTRIDPLAGLAQSARFSSRLATGKLTTPASEEKPVTASTVGRFLRTKLSPVLAIPLDLRTGTDVVGGEVTYGSALKNMATPLALRDILDATEDQGVPRATALGLLSIFGAGVNTYQERIKKRKPFKLQ